MALAFSVRWAARSSSARMSLLVVGICIQGLVSGICANRDNTTDLCVLQEERQVFLSLGSALLWGPLVDVIRTLDWEQDQLATVAAGA